MRKFFEGFFICCAMMTLSSAAQAAAITRVVVYGDSLMSGYQLQPEEAFPAKLQRKLQEVGYQNFEVINMSVPAETTMGGLERINSVLARHPDIVVVELGANDALRGVGVTMIYHNLANILGQLQQQGVYIVLVGMKAPQNMGYSYSTQLDQSYPALATAYKAAFYPFALEGVWGNPDLNQADGYHPNGRGVDVMVEGVYRLVDAGMRWKYQMQQNQDYQQQQMQYQQQLNSTVSPTQGPINTQSPQIMKPEGAAPRLQ